MSALKGCIDPCTLGFRWGLEGTELRAFNPGPCLCWAQGKVLPQPAEASQEERRGWEAPHHLCPRQTNPICKQEREALGFSAHYLSSRFSASWQLRP